MRNGVFGTKKMASRVDRKQCIPLRCVEVSDEARVLKPRILNQNVEPPKPCDAPFDEIANLVFLRHVCFDKMRAGTKFLSSSMSCCYVDVGDDDSRTFVDELLRGLPSNVVDGPGDDDALAPKTIYHCGLLHLDVRASWGQIRKKTPTAPPIVLRNFVDHDVDTFRIGAADLHQRLRKTFDKFALFFSRSSGL